MRSDLIREGAMPRDPDEGSVTHWIGELKAGRGAAAQPLWERYFERLVRLAGAKLRRVRRPGADEDEEDAALSAFQSLCAGAAQGRFPRLNDRDDLWRLLVVITLRKAQAQARRRRRLKRGGAALPPAFDREQDDRDLLERAAGREPTPEFAAQVAEEFRRLLDALGDDELRQIAVWRMEGVTGDEIAERLGCARRTVARRLDLIRKEWGAEQPG
jgi:DNA-directed RNA polymerase specialized sigma24 family protein